MALIGLYPCQNRPVDVLRIAGDVLELSDVFVGMKWDDAIVVVGSGYKHGWVSLLSNVMKRGIFDNVVDSSLLIGIAIL